MTPIKKVHRSDRRNKNRTLETAVNGEKVVKRDLEGLFIHQPIP
jgi:hypothetical protein